MRNRIERSRHAQIALTYTKPFFFRLWAVAVALYLLWVGFSSSGGRVPELILMTGGFLSVWWCTMVTAHAKEQLADARAAVTPGFRLPHVAVAAALLFLGAVVFPMWVAGHLSPPGVRQTWTVDVGGYLAVVLMFVALMTWMGHVQSPPTVAVMLAVAGTWLLPQGMAVIGNMVTGRRPVLANLIATMSLSALAGLLWRLARMHEEMPEYYRVSSPGLRLKAAMTGDRALRRQARADAGKLEAFIRGTDRADHTRNLFAASFWTRARQWRVVAGLGRVPLLLAVMLGTWAFLTPLLFGMPREAARFIVPLMISTIVPPIIVAGIWPRRWYVLAEESLRPASRRQFVREQGAAMAAEHAATWLWITGGVVVSAVLQECFWPSRVSTSATAWSDRSMESAWTLLRVLPVAAAGQVFLFGLIVWILRYRSGWLMIAPLFVVAVIGVLLLVGAMALRHDPVMVSLAAAVLAAVGVGIALDAYRRWLVTEFD